MLGGGTAGPRGEAGRNQRTFSLQLVPHLPFTVTLAWLKTCVPGLTSLLLRRRFSLSFSLVLLVSTLLFLSTHFTHSCSHLFFPHFNFLCLSVFLCWFFFLFPDDPPWSFCCSLFFTHTCCLTFVLVSTFGAVCWVTFPSLFGHFYHSHSLTTSSEWILPDGTVNGILCCSWFSCSQVSTRTHTCAPAHTCPQIVGFNNCFIKNSLIGQLRYQPSLFQSISSNING